MAALVDKKGGKKGAEIAKPRFGRIRSNLKVGLETILFVPLIMRSCLVAIYPNITCAFLSKYADGYSGLAQRR